MKNKNARNNDANTNPDDVYHASYSLDGNDYAVSIKGNWPTAPEAQTYYTATYANGDTKTIVYKTGKGWLERDAGDTPHAKALGNLVEEHFES